MTKEVKAIIVGLAIGAAMVVAFNTFGAEPDCVGNRHTDECGYFCPITDPPPSTTTTLPADDGSCGGTLESTLRTELVCTEALRAAEVAANICAHAYENPYNYKLCRHTRKGLKCGKRVLIPTKD